MINKYFFLGIVSVGCLLSSAPDAFASNDDISDVSSEIQSVSDSVAINQSVHDAPSANGSSLSVEYAQQAIYSYPNVKHEAFIDNMYMTNQNHFLFKVINSFSIKYSLPMLENSSLATELSYSFQDYTISHEDSTKYKLASTLLSVNYLHHIEFENDFYIKVGPGIGVQRINHLNNVNEDYYHLAAQAQALFGYKMKKQVSPYIATKYVYSFARKIKNATPNNKGVNEIQKINLDLLSFGAGLEFRI